ncbi:MAG: ribosome silencing factor [Thermovenabulum sp.]|uniref:ribosome silencing factor n=1 Tax=Thermovenabulum sp. TaxID=3100335 RepID=UPI003C7ED0D9
MDKIPKEIALQAAKILDEKKAKDIVILDISRLTVMADFFVIASGNNAIHVRALADEVEEKLSLYSIFLRGKEGYKEARWVLLDYGDVIIHIFNEPDREYYDLERLWADAVSIDVDSQEDFSYNIS